MCSKTNYFLWLFGLAASLIFLSMPTHANRITKNYCSPFYSGIKTVLLDYEEGTPYKNTDWKKIISLIAKRGEKILSKGNIKITVEEKQNIDLDSLSEEIMYVKIIFSYADTASFTIAPPANQLVTWAEFSHKVKDENGDLKIVTERSKINLTSAPDSGDPKIILASAPFGILENISCDVLHFSAKKTCTDRTDFTLNKVVPVDRDCVTREVENDPMLRYYLNSKIRQERDDAH